MKLLGQNFNQSNQEQVQSEENNAIWFQEKRNSQVTNI